MIMTTTLGSLEMYAMFTICNITGAFAMSAFMIIMFAFYSWHMALLSLVGLVIGYIVLQSVQRRAHRHTLELEKAEAEMISSVMEYTRGIGVLRSHVNAKSGQSDVLSKFEKKRDADYTQEKAMSGVLRRYQMVYKLIGGAMVVLSGSLYFSGILNMNEAIVYMIASFFVYSEIENMGDSAFLSTRINNQLERLDRIVDIPEVEESNSPIRFKNGDIEFENVSFAYDKEMILKNIDIKVKNKSKTAIVGPSGSGKTTLCKLIGRFWDVSEGKVLIGKNDIRDYEYSDLMNNISMVFQNVYLFRDTIRANIAFGSENASDEEIIAAAKSACCHDFIMDLPDGYDTVIGEGGSSLSGGEKQRISIARAILKDAPIIIFDEATSSIDPENEALLVEAMTKLSRGKTVITIAHKLSTIQNADEIVVIEEGKIVQRGEHDKLASEKGVYSRFLDAVRKSENWSIK
jgi:ATP-binding cassette subfamily B protein